MNTVFILFSNKALHNNFTILDTFSYNTSEAFLERKHRLRDSANEDLDVEMDEIKQLAAFFVPIFVKDSGEIAAIFVDNKAQTYTFCHYNSTFAGDEGQVKTMVETIHEVFSSEQPLWSHSVKNIDRNAR